MSKTKKALAILRDHPGITANGILLQEYRKQYKKETGYRLDEKEILFG